MNSLGYLNKYFVKYKWRFLLGILFIGVTNVFNVIKPEFFGDAIDNLEIISTNNQDDILWEAFLLGLIYMGIALASGFFLFLQRQTIIIMSRLIEFDIKNEIYHKYQQLSYTFYKRNSTGDLMNRISEDVSKVRMYLGPGVMYTINLAILSIMAIYNMVSINGFLTIVVLIPLPIMSFIIYSVTYKIVKLNTKVQEEQSNLSTLVQETFSGIRVVKAYSRSVEIGNKFNDAAEEYKNRSMRLVLVNSLFMPTIFILIGISTILSIYLGGLMYHDATLTKGEIIKFIFYVNMLTWPFASVGWVISLIQSAAASQTRINEFLEQEEEISNNSHDDYEFQGKIEFINVSFTYPNSGIKAVDDLSFVLHKGKSLGIVGKTGSGKSTILKLLMRQIEPDAGSILLDGVDIKEINLDSFRDQTGIVPQDVFLFSDTIRNNLLFGTIDNNATNAELIEVSKKAHLYHNIEEFENGFDTLLGERGVNLSGGQKQRLSIARALIRKPKLLILDDCLSAVDTETEEIILNNLKEEQVTSLIVSHRISSIRNADKIINIEDGSAIETGSHFELMQKAGSYAELYNKQLAEEAL